LAREENPTGRLQSILIAPDSFKGTFGAAEVAAAMAAGARDCDTGHRLEIDECPVADGGEGTGEVLLRALGGRQIPAPASDPLGRTIEAGFALLEGGAVAVVETAAASGLGLVEAKQRDAVAASTAGTGELIVAAARSGARKILLAVGGTATSDGGQGAIDAIGRAGGLGAAELVVLADVESSFEDAARIFAAQKGATEAEIEYLSDRLEAMAGRLPASPLGIARTGAGGGIAGGLWASYGARIVSGADYVLDTLDFDARIAKSDLVLVGEGRLDTQSLGGKIVGQILKRTIGAGVTCQAIVASSELSRSEAEGAGLAAVRTACSLDEIRAAAREATRSAGQEETSVGS
jgi:glycerate kinase